MKILIVDDEPLVCRSLKLLISHEKDMEVIATANDGAEALSLCKKQVPDVVLMDIRMPSMNGVQAAREIKSTWPEINIMMLTTFQDEKNIRLALQAGASGYILKSEKFTEMARQIRLMEAGTSVLDAEVLKRLTKSQIEGIDQLTPREKDIMELVAEGLSNQEIANQLFISEGTVRNTVSIILDKLELRDRTQLAVNYWRNK